MNSLKNFVLILGTCFLVPTYCMVAHPFAAERNRQSVPYVMEEIGSNKPFDDGSLKGLSYPSAFPGDRKRGELVYAREGCAQCHTQVIRPDYAGIDQFKKGWGKEQGEQTAPTPTRQTVMWDYMHEDFAMIGQRRIGPDLANAGYRFEGKAIEKPDPDAAKASAQIKTEKLRALNEFYLYLYAPRARHEWSISPGYRNLFITRIREGSGSELALKIPANLAPAAGMEIVPSSDARALAEYVLGLKRDQPIPVSITGAKPKAAK
jgi:cytochrome c oxidase cbb3-type subunit II